MPFVAPVMCPIFIGRQPERDALYRLIDRTMKGQGQVAFVSGEAGIGKSRLVAEAKTYAAAHGTLVLQGSCFPMDGSYPYAPLLDLLRASTTPTLLATDADPMVLEFARLLPELALSQAGPLPASGPDPEQEKRRLFVALTRFFSELASRSPMLLVIEDLHWCDDISLEYFQTLARFCATQPLLLLMTYRSDEVQPSLQRCLAQLDRARLSQELRLAPLARQDVDAMLSAMFALDADERAKLLDLIYPLTEGNPFFVEEVLTSLVARGQLGSDDGTRPRRSQPQHQSEPMPVPRSVQDAVQQRTQQLSMEARQVATYAAVAGRRFDFTVLQEIIGCSEERLLQIIKELLAIQFVVEVSAEQFAFRHALTQQAIYACLLARERRTLHRRLAEVMEHLYTSTSLFDAHLADIAYHYYKAESWSKALEYAQRVGERAMALYAPQAAIDHFTHALAALPHLAGGQPSPIYRLRGQAYETLGEFEHALSDYEQALETARAGHHPRQEWESMMALGFLWTGRDYTQAGRWFRQSGELAEKLADPILQARSLNRLGNWLMNTGRNQEGLAAHQEALRLFETEQHTQGIAETLDLLALSHSFSGDSANAVRHFSRAIELFRVLGDQQNLAASLAGRAIDTAPETIETSISELRTRDACAQDSEEALQLARQTNAQAGLAFAEIVAAHIWFSFGDFGLALTHVQEALRIATSIAHQQWILGASGALGQLYILMLQPDLAIAALDGGLAQAQTLGSYYWIRNLTSYLALAHILKQDAPRAQTILEAVMPRDKQPENLAERQLARVWGELLLAQGEPAIAFSIVERLCAATPGGILQPIPHLLALKGETLLALKRPGEAARVLEEARSGADQRQAPSVLWRILRALGRAYHQIKREEEAQSALASARQIIATLAETIEQADLRDQFLQAALHSFSQERPLPTPRAEDAPPGGLTKREIEVLRAVAQGLTDQQVAERLVISHRTVHSHLNSIYSKLGITSRSAATRYAIEHDLA